MSKWWLLVGAILSGPIWVAASVWAARRIWCNARQLATKAKGQEHLVELGQLTGGLAHEIKNPLSTINLNLKLLAEGLARYDDEPHRRLLRRLGSAQEETDRVKEILDDFLRFAGKVELSLAVADLRRLVSELVDFFAPQADAGRVVLRTILPESPIRCMVDASLIKQALLNLMLNAVQAMPDGGELLIRLTAECDSAVLEVTDTGKGIDAEDLNRVFQVYYSSRKDGTGLGLPASRRIIREHNGSLDVQSEPGKGTRFIINLPVVKE
ncbi:MAG: ATP-binding protein [Planctomycetota bacterium]|nr:ATP-binding protein [Planctomycetota bacterium]